MFEVREEEEKPVRAFLVGCVKAESINAAHFDVFASSKAAINQFLPFMIRAAQTMQTKQKAPHQKKP